MPDSQTTSPTTIEVWLSDSPKLQETGEHTLPGFGDPIVEAAKSFNVAHPEYEVHIRKIDFRKLPEQVAAAVSAGAPPAIAEYTYSSTQAALDTRAADGSPLFVPVQRALRGRSHILGEPVVLEDLLPNVRNYYTVGGELVSMPSTVTTNVLFANKDFLAQAGITAMPATRQNLEEACAAIESLDRGPTHGISWPNYGWLFHMEIAAQGGLLCNNDNGRSGHATQVWLDSAEMLNYVAWWQDMHRSGHYYYTGETCDYFAAMEAFASRDVGFVVSSSAVGRLMTDMAADCGFEVMIGPLPRLEASSSPGGPLGGQSFFLAAGLSPTEEDGALAFLQHQLNPQHAVARMGDRSLPVTWQAYRRLSQDDWVEPYRGFRIAAQQVMSAQSSPSSAGPVIGNLHGINTALTEAMQDVLLLDADLQGRLSAATVEAQRLLDRHNDAALANPPTTPPVLRGG